MGQGDKNDDSGSGSDPTGLLDQGLNGFGDGDKVNGDGNDKNNENGIMNGNENGFEGIEEESEKEELHENADLDNVPVENDEVTQADGPNEDDVHQDVEENGDHTTPMDESIVDVPDSPVHVNDDDNGDDNQVVGNQNDVDGYQIDGNQVDNDHAGGNGEKEGEKEKEKEGGNEKEKEKEGGIVNEIENEVEKLVSEVEDVVVNEIEEEEEEMEEEMENEMEEKPLNEDDKDNDENNQQEDAIEKEENDVDQGKGAGEKIEYELEEEEEKLEEVIDKIEDELTHHKENGNTFPLVFPPNENPPELVAPVDDDDDTAGKHETNVDHFGSAEGDLISNLLHWLSEQDNIVLMMLVVFAMSFFLTLFLLCVCINLRRRALSHRDYNSFQEAQIPVSMLQSANDSKFSNIAPTSEKNPLFRFFHMNVFSLPSVLLHNKNPAVLLNGAEAGPHTYVDVSQEYGVLADFGCQLEASSLADEFY